MTRRISIIMLLATLCLSVSADELAKRIFLINQHNGSISAEFTETKVMPRMKKETVKKGMLYFKSETEKLMMRYTDPAGDYTLIKDGIMYVRKGDKQQKFSGSNQESRMTVFKSSLIHAMQGNVSEVAKENKATIQSDESNTRYRFILTRKNEQKQGINSLTLLYDKATGALIMLKIEEANGNYTTYETTEPDVKTVLDDKVFEP